MVNLSGPTEAKRSTIVRFDEEDASSTPVGVRDGIVN